MRAANDNEPLWLRIGLAVQAFAFAMGRAMHYGPNKYERMKMRGGY